MTKHLTCIYKCADLSTARKTVTQILMLLCRITINVTAKNESFCFYSSLFLLPEQSYILVCISQICTSINLSLVSPSQNLSGSLQCPAIFYLALSQFHPTNVVHHHASIILYMYHQCSIFRILFIFIINGENSVNSLLALPCTRKAP